VLRHRQRRSLPPLKGDIKDDGSEDNMQMKGRKSGILSSSGSIGVFRILQGTALQFLPLNHTPH
jgi:hypothetical protein